MPTYGLDPLEGRPLVTVEDRHNKDRTVYTVEFDSVFSKTPGDWIELQEFGGETITVDIEMAGLLVQALSDLLASRQP